MSENIIHEIGAKHGLDDGMPLPSDRPAARRFKAAAFRGQAVEKLGQLASIEIELDDGSVVTIPHALALDGEQYKRYLRVSRDEDLDDNGPDGKPDPENPQVNGKFRALNERLSRAVLGDDEYERATRLGLHESDVTLAFRFMASEGHGSTPDGDDPKPR